MSVSEQQLKYFGGFFAPQAVGQTRSLTRWMDALAGWRGWWRGDEEQDAEYVRVYKGEVGCWWKVAEVKAVRVHPSAPIGQKPWWFPCSFEALKWSEFHHGHGDCSMSFGRDFWRDGPKLRAWRLPGMQGLCVKKTKKKKKNGLRLIDLLTLQAGRW